MSEIELANEIIFVPTTILLYREDISKDGPASLKKVLMVLVLLRSILPGFS